MDSSKRGRGKGSEKLNTPDSIDEMLLKTKIIVELHDCILDGITERMINKFSDTHELDGISQGTRDLHIEPLIQLSDLDKLIIYNENRPCTMTWAIMTPKVNDENL